MNNKTFYIVIPTFNEGDNILKITEKIQKQSELHNTNTKIYFINDCSTDKLTTYNLEKVFDNTNVFVYDTSENNKGQQAAIKLGLNLIEEGIVGVLDCDMQDPVEDLFAMYEKLANSNFEAVIGVRNKKCRVGIDSIFKRSTAYMYYKVISLINKKEVYDSSDFYVIRLKKSNGDKIDSRNIRQSIQDRLNFTTYYYNRHRREIGRSKYNISKLIKYAIEGIKYSLDNKKYRLN